MSAQKQRPLPRTSRIVGLITRVRSRLELGVLVGLLFLAACSSGETDRSSPRRTSQVTVDVTTSADEVFVGESITLEAKLNPPDAEASIEWDISGLRSRSGAKIRVTLPTSGPVLITAKAALPTGRTAEAGTFVTVYPTSGGLDVGFGRPPLVPGDVNSDGRVTILDALTVRRILDGDLSKLSGVDTNAGDLNNTGALDEEDVALIQCIVQDRSVLPNVLRPTAGHPGTAVQIISPDLLAVGPEIEIQFGNAPPTKAFRPRLGYANAFVPLELAGDLPAGGGARAIPVRILVDGQTVSTLSFEASPVPAPTMTASEALGRAPTLLRDAVRSVQDSIAPALENYTSDPTGIAAVRAVLEGALVEVGDAIRGMETFLALASNEQQDLVYSVWRANGMDEFLSAMTALSAGRNQRSIGRLAGDTTARIILTALCEIDELKKRIEPFAKAISVSCVVVSTALILFPPAAPVTAVVLPICTSILGAISFIDLALAFVPDPPKKLDVTADPAIVKPGDTSEIRVSYRLGIGSTICKGTFEGLVQSTFNALGKLVASILPGRKLAWELVKKWPAKSKTGNLRKKIEDAIEKFFGSAVGLVGVIELINTRLKTFRAFVCGTGQLPAVFELEPDTVLAGVPDPLDAGTLVIPPSGSGAPAVFTCNPNPSMSTPQKVTFNARFISCTDVEGVGQLTCGGGGRIKICFGDCGSRLDDFFELKIDGLTVSSPGSPVVNICYEDTLSAGPHTASLTGQAAPDGVGTYCISFEGDIQNVSGPPLQGTNLLPRTTFTWTFDVVPRN